jgi:peptidoglycan hydrolase-like protein with peptidoglycan-binding domain
MPDHVVRQGECLAAIAHAAGFAKPLDIWNDPHNAALRDKRHGDSNVLYPGDLLWIPEKASKTTAKPTGASHPFTAKVVQKALRIVIRDAQDEPVTGADWTLVTGGQTFTGKTDGQGAVEAKIPASATDGKLTVGKQTWPIVIGHLNPVLHTGDDGISGIQARLRNLGYLAEHTWGQLCDRTTDAIRRFQQDYALPPTGKPDAPTKEKIVSAHKDEVKPSAKPAGPPPPGATGFTVKEVNKLPDTPPLCTLKKKPKKKKPDPHPVSPTTTNVLAPPRLGKCSLCAKQDNCLDNDYDFLLAVAQMASRLQGDAGAFVGIMHFETGHTYSPKIQNSIQATGLIQIIPSTAKGLGVTTDELKVMCRVEQLAWVEKYFVNQKKPFPKADYNTVRDVVLAVFEPAGLNPDHEILGVSPDVCKGPFEEDVKAGKGGKTKTQTYWTATFKGEEVHVTKHQRAVYTGNAGLDRDKDGFIVREDYPAIVDGLLATCAKECAAKVRELQQGLGSDQPEYQIVKPGPDEKSGGGA